MVHHPSARRVHRVSTDPEDMFVERVLETSAWARRNARALLIGGAVAAVALLAGMYYLNVRSKLQVEAETQLNRVRQTIASGNPTLAESDLKKYLDQFGDTPSGDAARLLLAQVYLQTNAAAKAVTVLEPLADDVSKPPGPTAALLLGAAYEEAKQPQKAEAVYLRVADKAPFGYQKRDALNRAAILRMQAGNAAGAAALYRRILDEAPEDLQDRAFYQLRLGEAEAMAGASARG